MNRPFHALLRKISLFGFILSLSWGWIVRPAGAATTEAGPIPAKSIGALRGAIALQAGCLCAFNLEGTILAADSDSGTLIFQDDTGISALEVNLKGAKLTPGQRVRISGTNYVSRTDIGFSLGARPVINSDNLHSTIARVGVVSLEAGRHPIRVKWFNKTGAFFLDLAYSGPHIPKQTIPASALFQKGTPSGPGGSLTGLHYRCFEGEWEGLPDFDSLVPRKTGTVPIFDDAVRSRDENVGLEFKGFLEVPESGKYEFYLSSDDGSQLFLDDAAPELSILGPASSPPPSPSRLGSHSPALMTVFGPAHAGQSLLSASMRII